MKRFIKTACVSLCLSLAACSNHQTAKDIMSNPSLRDEVMTVICNDTGMAAQMISRLYATEASQKMLPLTCTILSRIQTSEAMQKDTNVQNLFVAGTMHLMTHDSTLCDRTCTKMNKSLVIAKMLQDKKPVQNEQDKVSPAK